MRKGRNGCWQRRVPVLLCVLWFGLAALFETAAEPVGIRQRYLAAGTGESAAATQALGEFRIVAANLLWAKVVDHYHHQYMAEGGDWSKNASLLPLLQTIVGLDPHFIEAYELMGGTILPQTGQVARGKMVLAEAIRNNPDEWELYREMALLYAVHAHDFRGALPYAQAGLRQADQAFARHLMDKTDHDFSHHLMTLLCHTLEVRSREAAPRSA